MQTETGSMRVSTPEATAFDLVHYLDRAVHPDLALEALFEMADLLDAAKLAHLADAYAVPDVQRLGFLLSKLGQERTADALSRWLEDSRVRKVPLVAGRDSADTESDTRWRALVELFNHPDLRERLAFRGGTALNKLYLPPSRYSEDIDLVQRTARPIGDTMDAIQEVMGPWLGQPKRKQSHGPITMTYRFESTHPPVQRLRLKVEINTREHFSVLGFTEVPLTVESRWFSGTASVKTYELEELLGTKLRALYQRKKGRDLFDLWIASRHQKLDSNRVAQCFLEYLRRDGQSVSRAEFEQNLHRKADDPSFTGDLRALLVPGTHWNLEDALRFVFDELLVELPGAPWKGDSL